MPKGWFTNRTYLMPERLTSDESRRRKFFSDLSKQRQLLESRTVPLSQANKFHLNQLKEFEAKFSRDIESRRREVAALKSRDSESRRLKLAISGLSNRLQQRLVLQTRADAERRRNARSTLLSQASAADRRFYFPGSRFFRNPRSIFGTEALVAVSTGRQARNRFAHAVLTIPCIQRVVRKEVLFAKGHGGRGHRVKHRRGPLSHIGC